MPSKSNHNKDQGSQGLSQGLSQGNNQGSESLSAPPPKSNGKTQLKEPGETRTKALGQVPNQGLTRAGIVDQNRPEDLLAQGGQRQVTKAPVRAQAPKLSESSRIEIGSGPGIAQGIGQGQIPVQQAQPVVPPHLDRVRAFCDPAVNALIDEGIRERLSMYAGQSDAVIGRRIAELEREWDIERFMAVKTSGLAFVGLVLGLIRSRKWLLLPLLTLPFLFQHSTTGSCMSTGMVRRMGFRTRHEIEAEKYALKVLRGDFGDLDVNVASAVEAALQAVSR